MGRGMKGHLPVGGFGRQAVGGVDEPVKSKDKLRKRQVGRQRLDEYRRNPQHAVCGGRNASDRWQRLTGKTLVTMIAEAMEDQGWMSMRDILERVWLLNGLPGEITKGTGWGSIIKLHKKGVVQKARVKNGKVLARPGELMADGEDVVVGTPVRWRLKEKAPADGEGS